ncbi:CDP-alcohol phosphatidyltransferase family protein [Candidatus Margulisiibacteriota bacterium]
MKPKTRHLANLITMTRIFGVGLIFWLTPYKSNYWLFWTVIIYTVVCLTDYIDGWVARKLNIESDMGRILDPLADKILVLVFLPLLEMQAISSFPVFIILAREFAIMAIRIVSAKKGNIIPAKFPGKIKTAITLPVCGILFARVQVTEIAGLPQYFWPLEFLRKWIFAWPGWVFSILIWATVVITIWSFLDYLSNFITWQQYVKKTKKSKKKKAILYWLIPNTITLSNLMFGIFGIIFALLDKFQITVVLILMGTLLDALDGKLARKFSTETIFGAKMDSWADFINFGIAPAVIIFRVFYIKQTTFFLVISILLAVIYCGSVYYRLKRFDQKGHAEYFEGVPSPIGAALVSLTAVSLHLSYFKFFIFTILLAILLMVSKIPYPHMETAVRNVFFRYLRYPAFIFFVLTIMNLLFMGFLNRFFVLEGLLLIAYFYVCSPLFLHKTS